MLLNANEDAIHKKLKDFGILVHFSGERFCSNNSLSNVFELS